ncbi:MAG: integrase [Planctomycetes bacterium]|nr:integrase [Planctomycetota bacterium]
MKTQATFPGLLQAFFTDRLMRQLQASPNTIASYRDTFRLLLGFAQQRLKKAPSALTWENMDAPFLGAFLEHLEKERGNSARSRNARLAAIHSFYRYAALHEPTYSASIQRVLAMPSKRYDHRPVEFLSRPETDALLSAPDPRTKAGRRDRALLLVAVQTGLRVSELIGLRCQDIVLTGGAYVRCHGKGRKERCTPLRKESAAVLRGWLRECNGDGTAALFPNARGGRLSRDGVEYLLRKHVAVARQRCPSLQNKTVSPHVLRHTAAMELLQHGVDRSVIALWLGHERMDSVQAYLHANLELKEQALARTAPHNVRTGRYRPDDELLAFLKAL